MKHVVKVARNGPQVRVTIPKELVESSAFKTASHALAWKGADGFIVLLPFVDEAMLRGAIQGDTVKEDPGA